MVHLYQNVPEMSYFADEIWSLCSSDYELELWYQGHAQTPADPIVRTQ